MTDQLYEIHLTIPTDNIVEFRDVCGWLNVKPIVIDLQDSTGDGQLRDVMTSSRVKTSDIKEVFAGIDHLALDLKQLGYSVVREKVETTIDNPLVPTTGVLLEGCYFEAHFAVTATSEMFPYISAFARAHGMHLSRNPFKKLRDGLIVQMMTLRAYSGTAADFDNNVNHILLDMHAGEYVKVEREYVLFDSNRAHEGSWGIAA